MMRCRLPLLVVVLLSLISLNVVNGQCLNKTGFIINREKRITNLQQTRVYYLCPGVYNIGELDPINMNLRRETGQFPIPLRPNMAIYCYPNGLASDGCIIRGGTRQVDGTNMKPYNDWITEDNIDNVNLYGLTFESGDFGLSVDIKKPGRVTFTDCAWVNSRKSMGPILLDYYNPDKPTELLETTFNMCNFTNNKYFGSPALPALITNNGIQNSLTIKDTVFVSNNMKSNNTKADTNSFLIDSTGPTILENNCFFDNSIGVSPVVNFGNTLDIGTGNYGDQKSKGTLCNFVSTYTTQEQVDTNTPNCIEEFGQVSQCGLLTPPPTKSPKPSYTPTKTPQPSPSPTISPEPTWSSALPPPSFFTPTSPQPTISTPPPTIPPTLSTPPPTTNPTISTTQAPTIMPFTFMPTVSPTVDATTATTTPQPVDDVVTTPQPVDTTPQPVEETTPLPTPLPTMASGDEPTTTQLPTPIPTEEEIEPTIATSSPTVASSATTTSSWTTAFCSVTSIISVFMMVENW